MKLGRYELLRHKGHRFGSNEIKYLRGIEFSDLLGLYLGAARSDHFFFIQVGAHDGVSNDYLHEFIMRFALHGILIEPQLQMFSKLSRAYAGCPHLVLENAAIADRDGEARIYTINPELSFLQYANQIASLNRDHALRMIERHLKHEAGPDVVREFKERRLTPEACIAVETVRASTFSSLLKKHGVSKYNLLQVDTEGFDFEILKAAEIPRYRPAFINYEHEHLSLGDQQQSWRFLRDLGYRLISHDRGDTAAYRLD